MIRRSDERGVGHPTEGANEKFRRWDSNGVSCDERGTRTSVNSARTAAKRGDVAAPYGACGDERRRDESSTPDRFLRM